MCCYRFVNNLGRMVHLLNFPFINSHVKRKYYIPRDNIHLIQTPNSEKLALFQKHVVKILFYILISLWQNILFFSSIHGTFIYFFLQTNKQKKYVLYCILPLIYYYYYPEFRKTNVNIREKN